MSIEKQCPRCGGGLVIRRNGESGQEFLGCSRYAERDAAGQPRCTHTEPLPQSIVMQRLGYAMLPGLE